MRVRAPFGDNDYITFGVMNRFERVNDAALRCWGRILSAVPDARLFMVVGDADTPAMRLQVDERLGRAGIDFDRLTLQNRVNDGYLELYRKIDIALDPFPYNGGTASCDTLAIGVPFVTLCGTVAVERSGTTLRGALGLDEFVAHTVDDHTALASHSPRIGSAGFGSVTGCASGCARAC